MKSMAWAELIVPGYAALYVLLAIGGVRLDLREKAPAFIVGLDLTVSAFALLGYGAYHLGYRAELLVSTWKIVAPLLVAAEACLVVRDLRTMNPESDFSAEENVWVHAVGAWLGILVLLPVHWFNLKLGYGW